MWINTNNSEIRFENGQYCFNAYFTKDSADLNTGIGFDHNPTQEEMNVAVSNFLGELNGIK